MVGKPFVSPFGDLETNRSEVLDFTFNIESDPSQLHGSAFTGSDIFHPILAGNIKFAGDQSPRFWKSIVSLCAICAIFSFGFYYMLGDYKAEIGSYISVDSPINKVLPLKALEKPDLIAGEIIRQNAIDLNAIPKQIEIITSAVEKIKQEEKRESKTQLATPDSKLDKTSKRINSQQIQPKAENFKTNSLAVAKRLSANTRRYTFTKFGAEWCVSCKLMESTALLNQSVVDLLDTKFIVLDVNVDEPTGYKIKEEFYVEKLPTLIILDERGNEVSRQEGAIGTSGLIEMLSSVAQYIFVDEEGITTHVKEENAIRGE
ncbi:MAG: thiol-disulfide isomerase/thioredoxin [Saprospiraceae bacterium]|jgi:thiol-disulfide isomerase/thioredoxin